MNGINLELYGIYDDADKALVMNFLKARHIETAQEVESIFNPSSEDEHDIMIAAGAKVWLANLFSVQNTNIVIVGDYDADGVMASTVAYEGLRLLGIGKTLNQYVPIREDGYGLSKLSVEKLLTQYPDVQTIITVDNGVVAYEGVEFAKSKGLTVLVTDHHLGKTEDTIADAIVDINRDIDNYPFKGLSGTAVIWKLLQAYARTVASSDVVTKINNLIDYVGISTMTDIMPVLDENRYFVREALDSMNKRKRLQWSALFDVLKNHKKLYGTVMNEEFIGYTLGPMINAVGRVTGSPELAYRFFRTNNLQEMRNLAEELFQINEQRKEEVKSFAQMASERYDGVSPDAIIVALPLKIGYAGLVASELNQRFDRPVVVLGGDKGVVHGSARSPKWFNIVEAFDVLYDEGLIAQFGGHAGAAGLEMDVANVDLAQSRMSELVREAMDSMTDTDRADLHKFHSDLNLHLETNFAAVDKVATDFGFAGDDDLIQISDILDKMRPFGQEFEEPVVKIDNVDFVHAKRMGAEKQHAKVPFGGMDILAWNVQNDFDTPKTILGSLGVHEFRGNLTPQLIVKRFVN